MNNIDIREYIINNFRNEDIEKIRNSIETTINNRDEDALIGMGVLFEILWNKLNKDEQKDVLQRIYDEIVNKKN